MHLLFSDQRGFNFIELMTAVAIFLIAMVAVVVLVVSVIRVQEVNTDAFQAQQLAREGVEIVRSIRDANWQANRDWQVGLLNGVPGDITAVPIYTASEQAWTGLDFQPNSMSDTLTQLRQTAFLSTHTEIGQETPFRRLIELRAICLDDTGIEGVVDDVTCQESDTLIGVDVVSTVQWSNQGDQQMQDVSTKLYGWK